MTCYQCGQEVEKTNICGQCYTCEPLKLLWLDLETTGLNPKTSRILEIACIITDQATLKETDRTHAVFHYDGANAFHRPEFLEECRRSSTVLNRDWDYAFSNDLLKRGPEFKLAGYSPHFDLSFMEIHMPLSFARLSHRVFDASTLRAVGRHWLGWEKDGQSSHRAMPDVESALSLARRFRNEHF